MSQTAAIDTQSTQNTDTTDLRAAGTEILRLPPEAISLDEHTDVRPWVSAASEAKEAERIEALAATIEEEGQLQAGMVREIVDAQTGDVTYSLIMGRRRRAAIMRINERRAEKGGKEAPMTMNVSVLRDVSDDSAFRKAMIENAHRLNLSPMQVALNIVNTRTRMGWDDKKDWSKRVAEFLGVSRAFVTQKVKLFDLSPEIQEQVHNQDISEETAWALFNVKPEKRTEVLDAAKAKASEEAKKKAAKGETGESEEPTPAGSRIDEVTGEPIPADPATPVTPAESGKVTAEHVTSAAREVVDSTVKPIGPLTRKEIIQSIEQFDSDVYGHKNGAVRKFISYFVDTYAKGNGTSTMLKRQFNKMVEGADKGTPEPEVQKPVKAAAATAKATPAPKAASKGAAGRASQKPSKAGKGGAVDTEAPKAA